MFYLPISLVAHAVYSSALPFAPSCDLQEQYRYLAAAGPDLVRGRLAAWPVELRARVDGKPILFVAISPDGKCVRGQSHSSSSSVTLPMLRTSLYASPVYLQRI